MKIPGLPETFEIDGIHWEACRLPMTAPLVTGAASYDHRDVLLLQVDLSVDGHPTTGFGEAAPLPGWSTETLDDCRAYLNALETGRPLPDRSVPSLLFGLELAILDGIARHRQVPLYRVLADLTGEDVGDQPTVPLQKPLGIASPEATARRAREAVDAGFTCLKLKVSGAPPRDLPTVEALREACPDVTLRLDANGAFSPDDALRFVADLADHDVDLFEEPIAPGQSTALSDLRAATAIPIAADETCSPASRCLELIRRRSIDALVLKPSSLGGLLKTLSVVKEAQDAGLPVVLSTLLDGAVGRHGIAHLAAALPSLPGPHGLGTGSLFTADLCTEPDDVQGGALRLHDGPGLGFVPGGTP